MSSHNNRRTGHLPAYGPINGVLGYIVFYMFATRATPTIVEIVPKALGISASFVRFGLAAMLWFILGATLLDQIRRQFNAFRKSDSNNTDQLWIPSDYRVVIYLAVILIGGLVAVWTFDRAVETGISLIQMVVTLETSLFIVVDFVELIVFFIAFSAATWAFDRLVIGGLRAYLAA